MARTLAPEETCHSFQEDVGADKGMGHHDQTTGLETITPLLIDTKGALLTCGAVTPVSLCFSLFK